MSSNSRLWPRCPALCCMCLLLACLAGCDSGTTSTGYEIDEPRDLLAGNAVAGGVDPAVVLKNVIELIRAAPETPGGDNFRMAAESLNDFFLTTPDEEFVVDQKLDDFLAAQALPPDAMGLIRRRQFDGQFDGRHLEDSLLLRAVSTAILNRGEPLESSLAKAERLFQWVVRNIQLVPPGSLAPPGAVGADGRPIQPQARPYDVLVRGLASEDGVEWADRSWAFLALCKQAGIDAAYLALVDPNIRVAPSAAVPNPEKPVIPFLCGVLVNNNVYLFDLKHGFAIANGNGTGVATLQEAAENPIVLGRLDLPGLPFPVHHLGLEKVRVRVLLDATIGSMTPRMKLLQDRLTGSDRMVLYRDPTELREKFTAALGSRLENVYLWSMPLNVEYLLFHENMFNTATGFAMKPFDPQWPLLRARLLQLRGDLSQAIEAYAAFRFSEDLQDARGELVGRDIQQILDIYATQFLALAQLDMGREEEARFLFTETLRLLPEPAPELPFFLMFRWGANRNLAELARQQGNRILAIRYYTLLDPTFQAVSNRLKAQELLWADPFTPDANSEMPPAPKFPAAMRATPSRGVGPTRGGSQAG